MDAALVILIIIIGVWSKFQKQKKKAAAAAPRQSGRQRVNARKSVPQAAPPQPMKAPLNAGIPLAVPESDDVPEEERDGSIDMPPMEPHEHEGKPMPCPAEERERPRPRPSQVAAQAAHATQAGLQLSFNQKNMVQAVVMAEVLQRPRFDRGRRVIR